MQKIFKNIASSKLSGIFPRWKDLLFGGLEMGRIILPIISSAMREKNAEISTPLATSLTTVDIEKKEIIERCNWLCEKIIVSPKELKESYPKILGRYYGPQWSIYSAVMLVAALANIIKIWPVYQKESLPKIEQLISLILSPEIKEYDAKEWGEDPILSLSGNKSHMTYLSLLAWCISLYRMSGGSDSYDSLYQSICKALSRRMLRSQTLNLKSFPNRPVFFPDMLVTIVALRNYGKVFNDNTYEGLIEKYLDLCETEWLHSATGLLSATLRGKRKSGVRGSYAALSTFWLTQIDERFAYDQYTRMIRYLLKSDHLTGIREYLNKDPELAFDPDAGPILHGLSPSGTAFAIGSATFFQDWNIRTLLLATAEKAGGDVRGKKSRHYKLGEFALVGEATALAMRTNFPILNITDNINL